MKNVFFSACVIFCCCTLLFPFLLSLLCSLSRQYREILPFHGLEKSEREKKSTTFFTGEKPAPALFPFENPASDLLERHLLVPAILFLKRHCETGDGNEEITNSLELLPAATLVRRNAKHPGKEANERSSRRRGTAHARRAGASDSSVYTRLRGPVRVHCGPPAPAGGGGGSGGPKSEPKKRAAFFSLSRSLASRDRLLGKRGRGFVYSRFAQSIFLRVASLVFLARPDPRFFAQRHLLHGHSVGVCAAVRPDFE